MTPKSGFCGPVERVFVERIPCLDTKHFCRIYESQAGSCLYATAAVKGGSVRAGHTWSQRPKLGRGSLEPVGTPTLPLFPLCLLGCFRMQHSGAHPSPWCVPGRLFVAGNTCLLPSLSSNFLLGLSLSLSLSLFFSFLSFPFLLAWVSWCVLGRLCRSWEHRRFLLLFSFLSHPSLPHAQCTYTQTRSLQQVLNEVWLSSVCVPFIWFPVFHRVSPSHTFSSSFLSCPPVFMSGHLILSFVCTHMGPGLGVYAHNLLQLRFQVAQVFTMRFPFHRNHTHTHLCPVLSSFHVFAR